jgi:DNA primase
VALLRTTISDRTLRQIHDLGFTKVCIWLDPDKAGVEGAAKAYKKLTYFLPNEVLCLSFNKDREPKECTKEELKAILHGL